MIAIVSLAWGNIAALVQRNVKRILAYSSVSHAGFMLIAVAAASPLGERALLYYLVPYAAMSLGAFGVVAARERELQRPVTLQNLAGFGWERPFLGVAMWVFVLGMLGFPLTGGFIGKFYVFAAAYDHGYWWLIVAGVIATMISAYYYLGIVRAMYFRDAAELQLAPAGGSPPFDPLLVAGISIALVVTVGSFFAVQPLIDVAAVGRSGSASLRPSGLGSAHERDAPQERPGRHARLHGEDDEGSGERGGAERGQRPGRRLGRPCGTREDEQPESERPEERLDAGDGVVARVEECAERLESGHGGEGDRAEERVEGEPVGAASVRIERGEREQPRKHATHRPVASSQDRTVLLLSRAWRHSHG